jgi:hypothetical protein
MLENKGIWIKEKNPFQWLNTYKMCWPTLQRFSFASLSNLVNWASFYNVCGETTLFSPKAGKMLAIFVKLALVSPKLGKLR